MPNEDYECDYIQYGKMSARIVSAKWDSAQQVAVIVIADRAGNADTITGWGMAAHEQREAVVDHLRDLQTQ